VQLNKIVLSSVIAVHDKTWMLTRY